MTSKGVFRAGGYKMFNNMMLGLLALYTAAHLSCARGSESAVAYKITPYTIVSKQGDECVIMPIESVVPILRRDGLVYIVDNKALVREGEGFKCEGEPRARLIGLYDVVDTLTDMAKQMEKEHPAIKQSAK